jgi:hypothetical protein
MPPVTSLLNKINSVIINPLIILFFSIALLVFLWGILRFISNVGDESGRADGKKAIFWGIIGMFIMVAAFRQF